MTRRDHARHTFQPNSASGDQELTWDPEERRKLEERILQLQHDQLEALFSLVGIQFGVEDISAVIKEIQEVGPDSLHLDILMTEAEFSELLEKWVAHFEST